MTPLGDLQRESAALGHAINRDCLGGSQDRGPASGLIGVVAPRRTVRETVTAWGSEWC